MAECLSGGLPLSWFVTLSPSIFHFLTHRIGFHMGKKNNLPDGGGVRQQHGQAVDANALSGRWRQTVLQGFDVIRIHIVRLIITGLTVFHLLKKTLLLVFRVVKLRKSVGYFPAGNEKLEPVCQGRVFFASTRQR